ncbi:hypothetical protein [Pedobacter sp. B4-66]|uniref:hypothetical protein n=1 Tax=Pedobacter sp. B4-66 TaxID=2817280 RepID=UPI001BD9D940|nr:hypothetical protein [Pedobacter sp. B4-66]
MLRRDLITAEIQKLAQVLARIMGLKLEGKLAEADDLLIESLANDFGITPEELYSTSSDEFDVLLTEKAFPAEKLEMLSQFFYSQFDRSVINPRNDSFAEKLSLIYRILETKHHIVNMTNLDRQKLVDQYLNS